MRCISTPNLFSEFTLELVKLNGEPTRARSLRATPRRSSRTLVTESSGPRHYRFFPLLLPELLNGLHLPTTLAPPRSLPSRSTLRVPFRQLPWSFGGHPVATEKREGTLVLLPMSRISRPQGLREDVRVAEVCFALVGQNVREGSV
jgi:hypothetical protein